MKPGSSLSLALSPAIPDESSASDAHRREIKSKARLTDNLPIVLIDKKFLFLLLLWLLGFNSVTGQVAPKHIRNYGPELTRAGEAMMAVAVDDRGLVFFGTEKGVLTLEGDEWKIITIQDLSGIRSLQYDTARHRLWVGGTGTFGYLTCDANMQYRYISLSDSVTKAKPFKQVWQIVIESDRVTFMSNEAHFEWTESGVAIRDITGTFVYLVNGIKYYSQKRGPLSTVKNGLLTKVWSQQGNPDAVYYASSLDSVSNLLFTPYNGVFRHNLIEDKVLYYDSPLSTYLKKQGFYDACRISDSLIAIGTFYDGVVIANVNGKIVDQIGTSHGLTSNGIYAVQLDPFGKLWVATEYGISEVDLRSALPEILPSSRRPDLYVAQLLIDNDSAIYLRCIDQPVTLTRKPRQLLFHMAAPGHDINSPMIDVRLIGVDREWTHIEHLEHDYMQLSNGDFLFQIKWADEPDPPSAAGIRVIISEPWYQPLIDFWQYILFLFLFSVILTLVLTSRLRASKRTLALMVKEKTEAIEAQKGELLRMNEDLKQVNEELDILLYRSSHDLISPVKSVKGLLNLIKLSPAEHSIYIPLMEDRILRLENILNELNSFVKNVKTQPVVSRIHLKQFCEDVWHEMEFMRPGVNYMFQLNVPDDLVVECDQGRLKVILNNLVSNAIKYSDASKKSSIISVAAQMDQGSLVLRISDNGQGIRSEHMARLFEMFYRANERSNGLGLGLYLVKKIVDSLNGTIRIESEFLQGTRVEVRVPVRVL